MNIIKRLAIIVCTLAVTSYASDQADLKQVMTKDSEPHFKSGLKLYAQGCGNSVEQGYVIDANKCITALMRLKRATQLNHTLVEANYLVSKLYYYKPAQINWGLLNDKGAKSLQLLGLQHAIKAVEFDASNKKAIKLLSLYREQLRQPASRK